jgi:hypothetical protein
MRWGMSVERMGKMRNSYILVGKLETEKPLGRPRSRGKYNMGMHLRETECEIVERMLLAQGRDQWRILVNTAMNLLVPLKAGNFLNT